MGSGEVIVDDHLVKLGGEGEFVLGLVDTLLDNLGGIGATAFETAAELLYRGGLDEERKGAVAIVLLDIAATNDIHIEHDVLTCLELTLYLLLEGAVEAVGVYLLILKEIARSDALAELLGAEEEVFDSVLLAAAWCTACGRDGEGQANVLLHQVVDYGRLARARWGRENDEFTSHVVFIFDKRQLLTDEGLPSGVILICLS